MLNSPDITVGLIGAALGWGQPRGGLDSAPEFMREEGIARLIQRYGLRVSDYSDIRECPIAANPWESPRASDVYHEISKRTQMLSGAGEFCLALGGDHSISIGSIHGLLATYPNLRIIWVDAHGDMNTPLTSPTGFFHGMPLGLLLDEFRRHEKFPWIENHIYHDRIALIGVRDLDDREAALISRVGIRVFTAESVRSFGIGKVLNKALTLIDPTGQAPIHFSFDIDSVDPRYAKATGVPVPAGLQPSDLWVMGKLLASTGRLVSMDLVEFNPKIGSRSEIQGTWEVIQGLLMNLFSSLKYPPVARSESMEIPIGI